MIYKQNSIIKYQNFFANNYKIKIIRIIHNIIVTQHKKRIARNNLFITYFKFIKIEKEYIEFIVINRLLKWIFNKK